MTALDPRAEQNALDAVRETLSETLGMVLDMEHIDEVAPTVLRVLRSRLGGYLVDPVLTGLTLASVGELPAREIYLDLLDPDADNMIVQTYDGVEWTTLADEPTVPATWKVLDEGGQIHVGLVNADGTVIERLSGPSGPTRYGRRANAIAAARAQNNR